MATNTQECLLDAAEALFVENGFAATSLRSIATEAQVNLAATHYHFGSKEGLLQAVVHRRVTPINAARLEALDKLEKTQELSLEPILETFFAPLVDPRTALLPRLIGRIFSEPPSVSAPLLEEEFGEVVNRYVAALGQVIPRLPEEELYWRFQFMVGSMLQTLSMEKPIGYKGALNSQDKFKQLIQFSAAGLRAPSAW